MSKHFSLRCSNCGILLGYGINGDFNALELACEACVEDDE